MHQEATEGTPPTSASGAGRRVRHYRHRFVSDACRHGFHNQCSNACAYCAALCKCTSLDCVHHHRHDDTSAEHDDQAAADTYLRLRLALAIRNTPGYVTDTAAPWDIADSVINELKTVVKDRNV